MSEDRPANRRIDRIRDPSYLDGIEGHAPDDVRARRDECMAEREYLSLLRRLVQGRAVVLSAGPASRGSGDDPPRVDPQSQILASDQPAPARGQELRVTSPEAVGLLVRR